MPLQHLGGEPIGTPLEGERVVEEGAGGLEVRLAKRDAGLIVAAGLMVETGEVVEPTGNGGMLGPKAFFLMSSARS